MQQNITRSGRIVRAVSGAVCIGLATLPCLLGRPESVSLRWTIGISLAVLGLFQLWEARRGWCIARACGIKTPL